MAKYHLKSLSVDELKEIDIKRLLQFHIDLMVVSRFEIIAHKGTELGDFVNKYSDLIEEVTNV